MSVSEILSELERLTPDELYTVREKIDLILDDTTEEERAAIEEGLRSSREEPSCTIEDLEEDLRKWNSASK